MAEITTGKASSPSQLTKSIVERHIFNDDLLMNADDLAYATLLYPKIVHILDCPEIKEVFTLYDKIANKARSRMQISGIIAVFLLLSHYWLLQQNRYGHIQTGQLKLH